MAISTTGCFVVSKPRASGKELAAKQRLLDALRLIKKDGPAKQESGICFNTLLLVSPRDKDPLSAEYALCVRLAGAWPGGDGSAWPVASDTEPLGEGCYNAWDTNTENGQRRHELVGWMIDTLTKELQHGNMV